MLDGLKMPVCLPQSILRVCGERDGCQLLFLYRMAQQCTQLLAALVMPAQVC